MSRSLFDKCSLSLVLVSLLVSFVLISGCISVKQESATHTQLNQENISKKQISTIASKMNQNNINIRQIPTTSVKINQWNISDPVNGSNQFALDMLSQISDGQQKNIFLSPWSIYSALAIVHEGARGTTEKEMNDVLHFSDNENVTRQQFASAYDRLNPGDKGYALSVANALWVENDYPLLSNFTNDIDRNFHGIAKNVDFKGSTEDTRKTINSWVAERTGNKITDLISPVDISSDTRLIITNAVYFNGKWVNSFDKNLTQPRNFTTAEGKIIETPMMHKDGNEFLFNYLETDDMQALELPYQGERVSMIILLPKNDNISSLERSLSLEKLSDIRKGLQERLVEVYIPKFKFSTKYSLVDNLKGIGLTIPFASEADFSGIDGKKDLFISDVIHQAFVDVNEEGTEAAAATAVIFGATAAPPSRRIEIPVFRADHPFIFIIQERETGNILFMGRVSDPSKD